MKNKIVKAITPTLLALVVITGLGSLSVRALEREREGAENNRIERCQKWQRAGRLEDELKPYCEGAL